MSMIGTFYYMKVMKIFQKCQPGMSKAKNTGAWKGRIKRFFVNLKAVELAKMILISIFCNSRKMDFVR